MEFIVDAQLPKSLSALLNELGVDAIHTIDLPEKNRTSDSVISKLATEENRIIITKDTDFLESFIVKQEPEKLVLVRTGNIKNSELLSIFKRHLPKIMDLLGQGNLVEVTRIGIILHA